MKTKKLSKEEIKKIKAKKGKALESGKVICK